MAGVLLGDPDGLVVTTEPARGPASLAHRGIRVLAIAVVALIVLAVGTVTNDDRTSVLIVTTVGLAGVAAWHWRVGGRRSGIGTSAAVASVLVGLVLLEDSVTDVDQVLLFSGAISLASAMALRERRLSVTAFVAWALLLGRPAGDADRIGHCLLDSSLQVAVPRLDGPILLSLAAILLATTVRWTDTHRLAGMARGAEGAGVIGLTALLLAKAAELPGHRLLCGSGDPLDEGWLIAGVAVGLAMIAYGLLTRDVIWSAAGVGGVALQGILGTALTGQARWALASAALLGAGMVIAERAGVQWPDEPGYGTARPSKPDVDRLVASVRGES